MSEHFTASHRDELLKENRKLKERINRLEELAEELAYEDCAATRKDIWQGFKEAQ